MKKLAWLILFIATLAQASSITTSGSAPAIGGPITSGTTGSILFVNPTAIIAQDNASLFFDDTANRLGLGDITPDAKLDVQGTTDEIQSRVTGNGTQTNSILLVESSAAVPHLTVTGVGNTQLGRNLILPSATSTVGLIYGDAGTTTRLLNYFGTNNIFVGANTGNLTLSGADGNAALGNSNLVGLTTGDNNVGIGQSAGNAVSSGSNNIMIGSSANITTTTGSDNLSMGRNSGPALGALSNTIAIGTTALGNTTGTGNTGLGISAGSVVTSGTDNTFLGNAANTTLATVANATAIGRQANVAASNSFVMGNIDVANFLLGSDRTTTGAATVRTLRAGDVASGQANQIGGNLTIQGSRGTGSGGGGNLIFSTAPSGGGATTLNTPTTRFTLTNAGNADFTGSLAIISPDGTAFVGAADTADAGLWTAGTQTLAGNKTFLQSSTNAMVLRTTSTSAVPSLDIRGGSGTTSGRNSRIDFTTDETSPQQWRLGFPGTKNFSLVDTSGPTTLIDVSPTTLGVAIHGTNTNDSAAAGFVGEYGDTTGSTGFSAGFANVASITPTAGDWDFYANASLTIGTATGYTQSVCAISTSSAAVDGGALEAAIATSEDVLTALAVPRIGLMYRRISTTGATTVFLVCRSSFATAGTASYGGHLARRRVR